MRAKNLEDVVVYRTSGSVGPLIAEGFGQVTDRHFASYLGRARGSALETCAQLDRAHRKKYISRTELNQLSALYIEIIKMLTPWINYLYRCDWKDRGQPPGEETEGTQSDDRPPPD